MQVNLDEFFREQNDNFIVDEGAKDLHWQQMKLQLHPVTKPLINKKFKAVAIGVSVLALFTIGYIWKGQNNNTKTTTASNPNQVAVTTPAQQKAADDFSKEIIKPQPENSVSLNKNTVLAKEAPVNENKPAAKPVVASLKNTINKEAKFYIDLTKEPEVFTIVPTIENTITCKQGTTIHIPANLLTDKNGKSITENVNVIVQEYYRYEDEENKNNADAGMIKYGFFKGTERLNVPDNKFITVKMKSVIGNAAIKVISNEDALPENKLKTLSWVSAENFTADKRNKIDYKITLDQKYDASTFMSEIAFPEQKVIMAGDIVKNSIIFHNVPVGETVYFLSIGKINDKYFSCSKKLVTGNAQITELDFVEISEALYKSKIDELGKLGKEK